MVLLNKEFGCQKIYIANMIKLNVINCNKRKLQLNFSKRNLARYKRWKPKTNNISN